MEIKSILFITFVLITSANVNATTISFTGTLGFIEIDNGSTTFSRLTIGDSFSGSFTYRDSSADASSIVTNPSKYIILNQQNSTEIYSAV